MSKIPRRLTKKQKQKADKIIKLLEELSEENVTFFMNSIPILEIGFMRDAELIDGYDAFFKFLNSHEESDRYYSPICNLKLECYAA